VKAKWRHLRPYWLKVWQRLRHSGSRLTELALLVLVGPVDLVPVVLVGSVDLAARATLGAVELPFVVLVGLHGRLAYVLLDGLFHMFLPLLSRIECMCWDTTSEGQYGKDQQCGYRGRRYMLHSRKHGDFSDFSCRWM